MQLNSNYHFADDAKCLRVNEPIDQLPASLRLLITAGARIDAGTVSWFRRHLDRKVHSFYGSSETGGIAYDDSEDVSDPLHVGRAMPETTIAIRRPVPICWTVSSNSRPARSACTSASSRRTRR